MYKGKRATEPIAHHEDEDEEYMEANEQEQLGSEYSGDEEMGAEQGAGGEAFVTDENVDAEAADASLVPKHVDESHFSNRQTIDLDISFVGSLEEFEAGTAPTVWSPAASMMKHFKQNTATVNRHLADEKDLVGNLKRAVIFQAEVLEKSNSLNCKMGIVCDKMMSKTVGRNNAVLVSIPPTPLVQVNQKVFEPTDIFGKDQLENSRINTPEVVNSSITIHETGGKDKSGYATVDTSSFAYKALLHNLGLNKFKDQKLTRAQLKAIVDIDEHTPSVPVTKAMGVSLKNTLIERAKDDLARMVDLEKLEFRLVRNDGQREFGSAANLEGEMVGTVLLSDGINGSSAVQTNPLLLKRGAVHMTLRLTYGTLK